MASVCLCMYRALTGSRLFVPSESQNNKEPDRNQVFCVCSSTASLGDPIASGSAAGRFPGINKDVYSSCCGMSMLGEKRQITTMILQANLTRRA